MVTIPEPLEHNHIIFYRLISYQQKLKKQFLLQYSMNELSEIWTRLGHGWTWLDMCRTFLMNQDS